MKMKVQTFYVEVQQILDIEGQLDAHDEPITSMLAQMEFVADAAHGGNFIIRETKIEEVEVED